MLVGCLSYGIKIASLSLGLAQINYKLFPIFDIKINSKITVFDLIYKSLFGVKFIKNFDKFH